MYIYMCIHICIYIYICIDVYIYIYICIPVVRGYVLYWYRLGNSASSNWEHHLVGISFPAMKSHC